MYHPLHSISTSSYEKKNKMSRFLAEPITEKESASYTAGNLSIGRSTMQGWRDSMEVRLRVCMWGCGC